jgi:hypothetical protein
MSTKEEDGCILRQANAQASRVCHSNDATPGLTNRPNGFHNTDQPTPNIRYRNTRMLDAGWNKGLGFGANVSPPMSIPYCKRMSGVTG